MTDKFASGLLPYTAAERERDDEARLRRQSVQLARRRAAPHGRYDRAPSPQTRERDLRILGESR
jgi:hypothetical protein